MNYFIDDINNYQDICNQVLDIRNAEHIQYFIDIMNSRPVQIENTSTFINSDKSTAISFDSKNKELTFYEEIEEGLFKVDCKFIADIEQFCKYIFIEEIALIQGSLRDEKGNMECCDVVGINVNFLDSKDDFEYDYNDWLNATRDYVFANFYQVDIKKITEFEKKQYISI